MQASHRSIVQDGFGERVQTVTMSIHGCQAHAVLAFVTCLRDDPPDSLGEYRVVFQASNLHGLLPLRRAGD
ncbi:hypothetical protein DP49_5872 [Burkholderia pseudomallei]|nr:hypothetical protein DP49_5872 [Burkholderia pseudomallei]